MTAHINRVTINDTANGPGIRVVVWFQGCEHHCKHCHNPETWNPTKGIPLTLIQINQILDACDKPYIAGITLSGGDPFHPMNGWAALNLILNFRRRFKQTKTIWAWTGYTWEELEDKEERIGYSDMKSSPIGMIDVLVDGKFIEEQKDISLPYCGSKNQRVIDVVKSIGKNKVVLWQQDSLKPVKGIKQKIFNYLKGVLRTLQVMTFSPLKTPSSQASGQISSN